MKDALLERARVGTRGVSYLGFKEQFDPAVETLPSRRLKMPRKLTLRARSAAPAWVRGGRAASTPAARA